MGRAGCAPDGASWVVKDTPEGAVLVADNEDFWEMYKVLGIANSLVAPLQAADLKLPCKCVATLLPFRGRILYDGIMYGEKGIGCTVGFWWPGEGLY